MTGTLRLVRIEARRSLGLLLFLPLVAVAAYVARGELPVRLWLWNDTSFAIRETIILLGPLAAGLATWMAGRDRRRGMGDLLATTPLPAPWRTLATWAGTALWCAGVYLAVMLGLFGLTLWKATYGGPYLSIIAVGLLAVVAHTAVGFAAGHLMPSRFTAPVVAVGLFVAQAVPVYARGSIKHLSPIPDNLIGDVFYGLLHDPSGWQAVWLLGLTGLALSMVALRDQRSVITGAALALSLAIAVTGASVLLNTPVEHDWERAALLPYEPVCQEGPITVCVHPAYQGLLPETVELIHRVTEPLIGIPGAPTRAVQRSARQHVADRATLPPGTIEFELDSAVRNAWGFQYTTTELASSLVSEPSDDPDSPWLAPSDQLNAQWVIADWLIERTWGSLCEEVSPGGYVCWGWVAGINTESERYRERFNALDPAAQRAWFEKHYAALRAGTLSLEALP